MIKIEHLAIWVSDLEKMKVFYETYLNATSGEKYVNSKKRFSSYFLSFSGGARLELMKREDITSINTESLGLAHIAISLGSEEKVDLLTERLRAHGIEIAGEPRVTGDGYYESVIKDPEGNLIELTV